ncbi:hypothetical protein IE53DRAFT_380421 [Violaceomyces palustris]|uniref:Uncharacterized protein n=1 Tax=Violaceomyces palustris TaxID=1673888 RepID=A0ACD0NUZ8_9BASI|nr:hypothetical protein IE53DRAFT_380421 [Violaceomyces palustris]
MSIGRSKASAAERLRQSREEIASRSVGRRVAGSSPTVERSRPSNEALEIMLDDQKRPPSIRTATFHSRSSVASAQVDSARFNRDVRAAGPSPYPDAEGMGKGVSSVKETRTRSPATQGNSEGILPISELRRTYSDGNSDGIDSLSRTLPRGFNPATGSVSLERMRRPTLPHIFENEPITLENLFPNPHSRSGGNAAESRGSRTTGAAGRISSHQRTPSLVQPVTSPFAAIPTSSTPTGHATSYFDNDANRQDQSLEREQSDSVASSSTGVTSGWSSEGSLPTPTASSIAAARLRDESLQAELIPVQLVRPPVFRTPPIERAPATVNEDLGEGPARIVKGERVQIQKLESPKATYQSRLMDMTDATADVASVSTGSPPSGNAKTSKLPQLTSEAFPTALQASGSRPIPIFRNDFQNLKKISISKAGSGSGRASQTSSGGNPMERVRQGRRSETLVSSATAATSSSSSQPIKKPVAAMMQREETGVVPPTRQVPSVPTIQVHAPLTASERALPATVKMQKQRSIPSVGGHLLGIHNVAILSRKDGTARPIYSPTTQTLAAARSQPFTQQAKTGPLGPLAERVRSPLATDATVPGTPSLDYTTRFKKVERAPSSVAVSSIEEGERRLGKFSGSEGTDHQSWSDEADATRGSNKDVKQPNRSTFGAGDANLLAEANEKLARIRKEQEGLGRKLEGGVVGDDDKVGMGTSPQSRAAILEATEKRLEKGEDPEELGRRLSAFRSRRHDSFDSAKTAFDQTGLESSPMVMSRSLSGQNKEARLSTSSFEVIKEEEAVEKEGKSRIVGTVAPPSDVLEVKEEEDEGDETDVDSPETTDTEQEKYGNLKTFIINTLEDHGDEDDDGGEAKMKPGFRYLPISASVNATKGKSRRPQTGNSRVTFKSDHSRKGHIRTPACEECFRSGFDCAMNLQIGEGTAGRKAFQDFVASGGLQALSIRDGRGVSPIHEGSLTLDQALGDNYVDKLGEVAFGESALSRPVTRGMMDDLMVEKEEQERRKRIMGEHQPWSTETLDDSNLDEIRRRPSLFSIKSFVNRPSSIIESLKELTREDDAEAAAELASSSQDTLSDELDYLPDRWPLWRKYLQITVFSIYIFALQALDSGYVTSIPYLMKDLHIQTPATIGLGSLAFNGAQAGGMLTGAGLIGFGRQRIILGTLVLIGCSCVIFGFSRNLVVIIALRGLIGNFSGIAITITLASILDLFVTKASRLGGILLLIVSVANGQLSGPWIADLILSNAPWPWLYWGMLIVAGVMIFAFGIITRETSPVMLFRRRVLKLRRLTGVWTPEPQPPTTVKQAMLVDSVKPFVMLFKHWIVTVCSLSMTFFLSVYVFIFSGTTKLFSEVHHLSPVNAKVTSTVCGVIGVLSAFLISMLLSLRENSGSKLRPIQIDEKGYIDTSRPSPKVERDLILSLVGGFLFVLALYTMAISSISEGTWMFSALGMILLSTALILVQIGFLQYILETYQPPRPTKVCDVIAQGDDSDGGSFDLDRYTSRSRPVGSHSRDRADTESSDSNRDTDRRYGNQAAIASVSIAANLALTLSNAMEVPAMFTFERMTFQMVFVIFATVSILACSGPLFLFLYGAKGRSSSLAKIKGSRGSKDKTEPEEGNEGRRVDRGHGLVGKNPKGSRSGSSFAKGMMGRLSQLVSSSSPSKNHPVMMGENDSQRTLSETDRNRNREEGGPNDGNARMDPKHPANTTISKVRPLTPVKTRTSRELSRVTRDSEHHRTHHRHQPFSYPTDERWAKHVRRSAHHQGGSNFSTNLPTTESIEKPLPSHEIDELHRPRLTSASSRIGSNVGGLYY